LAFPPRVVTALMCACVCVYVAQVRDYIQLYLGDTPKAQAFCTEFLRRIRTDPSLSNRCARS
jgi:hypothetical protein